MKNPDFGCEDPPLLFSDPQAHGSTSFNSQHTQTEVTNRHCPKFSPHRYFKPSRVCDNSISLDRRVGVDASGAPNGLNQNRQISIYESSRERGTKEKYGGDGVEKYLNTRLNVEILILILSKKDFWMKDFDEMGEIQQLQVSGTLSTCGSDVSNHDSYGCLRS